MFDLIKGASVNYEVRLNGTGYSGSLLQIDKTFTTVGRYEINITASNLVTNVSIVGYIQAVDKLMGMKFHAGSFNKSTSTVGADAKFLFILETGMAYECKIIYGDGSTDTFNDYVTLLL